MQFIPVHRQLHWQCSSSDCTSAAAVLSNQYSTEYTPPDPSLWKRYALYTYGVLQRMQGVYTCEVDMCTNYIIPNATLSQQ